jgi:hypothetical protein
VRALGLILSRELRRTSRSASRMTGRLAVPGGLLLLVLVWVGSTDWQQDPGAISRVGRALFAGTSGLLLLLAAILGGALGAGAIHAERDGGTLELLNLTGIGPGPVLGGLLSSRLVRGVLLLATALPVLGLVLSLGGTDPWMLLALTLSLPVFALSVGAVAAYFALSASSFAETALATAGWAILAMLLFPVRLAWLYSRWSDNLRGEAPWLGPLHPAYPLLGDGEPWTLLSLVAPVVVGLLALGATAWRFRRLALGEDPRRSRTWPLPVGAALLPVIWLAPGWLSLEAAAFLFGLDRGQFYMDDATWAVLAIHGIVQVVSFSVLYLRMVGWVLPRLDQVRTGRRRRVWGWPVMWRELRTLAQGALSRATWIVTAIWVLLGGLLLLATEFDDDLAVPWAFLGWFGAVGMSVLILTRSIALERSTGTLELLAASTLPAWVILRDKMLAAMVRTLPLIVLGVLLVGLVEVADGPRRTAEEWLSQADDALVLTAWATLSWGVLLGLSALVALWSRRPAAGQVGGLVIAVLFPAILTFLIMLLDGPFGGLVGRSGDRVLGTLLFTPWIMPLEEPFDVFLALVSLAGWSGVLALVAGAASHAVRHRGGR